MDDRIEQFLSHLTEEKHFSENTITAYRNDLTQFMLFLGDERAAGWPHLRQQDILAFELNLKERTYAQSTLARKLASVRSFCHYLARSGLLTQDPAEGLNSPQVARKPPRTLTDKEVSLLLELPSRTPTPKGVRDRAILELLYATGMRVSEMTALDVGDVDFANGTVNCGERLASQRTVSLSQPALDALSAYVQEGRKHLLASSDQQALFVNHRGERLSRQGLWLVTKKYVRELGLGDNVTPQTMRHSAAAHRLSHGANVAEVQHLLGHTSPSSTQVYVRIARKRATEPEYVGA